MREIFYSPTAGEDLYRLRATPAELTGIHAQALLLAEGSKRGFLLPVQSPFLAAEERLYRYDVGRFLLNYKRDEHALEVASV